MGPTVVNFQQLSSWLVPCPSEVPTVQAQSIRLGEHPGESRPKDVQLSSGNSWKKNCSRQAWRLFKRRNMAWDVKLSTFQYVTGSGDVIPISYISPVDMFEYLLTNVPGVLVGGLQSAVDRAEYLHTFWSAYQLQHQDHIVYEVHGGNLSTVVPLRWHGDEGRGKRRGNTAVVSMSCVFGTNTAVQHRKRKFECVSCEPSPALNVRFGNAVNRLSQKQLRILQCQTTTQKGHSMLHHWPLFIIPSFIHHEHPQAMIQLMRIIAVDFKRLFYEGCTAGGKTYNAAIVGAQGDLKWFGKIALQRSWENQGRTRDIACCHECMAGQPNVQWENVTSDNAPWLATRWTQRPWVNPPCVIDIPFCRQIPEKQFKRDIFHLTKVGIYRDVAGSVLCFLVSKNYYGVAGTFEEKLTNAHRVFVLYCSTAGKTPALRTFSRRLLMYPRFDKYPWSNTKGSDTMLLLDFLQVQLAGFENDPVDPAHVPTLRLMRATCKAARATFLQLNSHGLWTMRPCTIKLFGSMQGFIQGYVALAAELLNDAFNGFAMKPKLHLLRHTTVELAESLSSGDQCALSVNCFNCEACEDLIGRTCRLSRRMDSRKIGERVLGCCLLKSSILYNRFRKLNKI